MTEMTHDTASELMGPKYSGMPTNDDTPTIDAIVNDAYAGEISWIHDQLDGTSLVKRALEEVEREKVNTKAAVQNLIDRARLDEAYLYRHEADTGRAPYYIPYVVVENRIKALEAKIKEG